MDLLASAEQINTLAKGGNSILTGVNALYSTMTAANKANLEHQRMEATHKFARDKYNDEERRNRYAERKKKEEDEDERRRKAREDARAENQRDEAYRERQASERARRRKLAKSKRIKKTPQVHRDPHTILPDMPSAPPAVTVASNILPTTQGDAAPAGRIHAIGGPLQIPTFTAATATLPGAPPNAESQDQTPATSASTSHTWQVFIFGEKLGLNHIAPAVLAISAVGLAYLVARFWKWKSKSPVAQGDKIIKGGRRHPRDFGKSRHWKPATDYS